MKEPRFRYTCSRVLAVITAASVTRSVWNVAAKRWWMTKSTAAAVNACHNFTAERCILIMGLLIHNTVICPGSKRLYSGSDVMNICGKYASLHVILVVAVESVTQHNWHLFHSSADFYRPSRTNLSTDRHHSRTSRRLCAAHFLAGFTAAARKLLLTFIVVMIGA